MDPAAYTIGVLDLMAPILLASVGEIIAERSGVVNIGVEGLMLASAWAAAAAAYTTGSPHAAIAAALTAATTLGLLHAAITVKLRGDQIISGIALNFIAYGAAVVATAALWGQPGASPRVPKLPTLTIAEATVAPTSLAAIPIAAAAWLLLEKTTLGLKIKAAGEDPHSAEAMGVNVDRVRTLATLTGAALAGLAGAHLAVGVFGGFSKTITGPGRGFIALANVAFSNWNPIQAILGAYIFGLTDTISLRLASQLQQAALSYPIRTLPYLATLTALATVAKWRKTRIPAALGKPYIKE